MYKIFNEIEVGIQSWCFRGLNGNKGVIAALKECNIGRLEICGIHVDAADKHQVEEVIGLYKDNNISFNSFGIDLFPNDEAKVKPLFEFAKKTGISALGADPDPDAFGLLESLCNEYSVKLAIHNHGRHHRYGKTSQLKEVFGRTSKNIGLCLDTGWALDAGEDPVRMVDEFSGRLYGIHFKDFNFNESGAVLETLLGEGMLDLEGLAAALKKTGFKGFATIEYEGDEDNPVPGIKKCIENISKVL